MPSLFKTYLVEGKAVAQVVGPRDAHDPAGRRPHHVVVPGQMEGWGERWDGRVLVGRRFVTVETSARRLTATRVRQLSPGLFPPSLLCISRCTMGGSPPSQPILTLGLPIKPHYLAVRFRSPVALPVVDVSPSKPW